MFKYQEFNTTIISDFEIPYFVEKANSNKFIQINIKNEIIPSNIKQKLGLQNLFIEDNQILFQVFGIAYYLISPKKIIVEPIGEDISVINEDIILFLVETSIPLALMFHQRFFISASGFILNEKLILLIGHKSIGKSFVVSQFLEQGYSFFTDEMVCIYIQNDEILATSGSNHLSLWQNSPTDKYRYLRYRQSKRKGIKKFDYNVLKSKQNTILPINEIYYLEDNLNQDCIVETHFFKKLKALQKATLFHRIALGMNRKKEYYSAMHLLAQKIKFTYINMPQSFQQIEKILKYT